MKYVLLLPLLSCLVGWCSKVPKVRKEALFLHAQIALNDELRTKACIGTEFLKDHVDESIVDFSSIKDSFADPAMAYLCKCGLKFRIALYNSGKFQHYLNAVKEAKELEAYVVEPNTEFSLLNNGLDYLNMFMQDALLLLAVSEHAGIIGVDRLNQVLSYVLSLSGSYVLSNLFKVLPNHTFVNFADFLETVTLQPVEFSPQDSILGKVNADRFVRLMETHRKDMYDLSKLCSFLKGYNVTSKEKWLMRYLKMDDSLQFYLRKRISEVSLFGQMTSIRHGFGYIYHLPSKFRTVQLLLTLEQVTYQFKYLFHTSFPVVVKESIMIEYAKILNSGLATHVGMWLAAWKHALHNGLTEIMDFQVAIKGIIVIHHKLSIAKLYFRNNAERLAGVKLDEMLLVIFLTTSKLD